MMNKLLILLLAGSVALLILLLVHGADAGPRPAVQERLPSRLDVRIPELLLDKTTLDQAIDALRELTHANIVVDWKQLEGAGVPRTAPVRLRLWDVTLSKALAVVLADAGDAQLDFQEVNGIITISTWDRLRDATVTRIYDIDPVLQALARHCTDPPSSQELFDTVARLLEDRVASDTWKDNGGTIGTVREICKLLIVTQTPANQEKVEQFLKELKEGKGNYIERLKLPTTQSGEIDPSQ